MNKDFILEYLKKEHLSGHSELLEIAEESGLEVVKLLLKNHSALHLYVPKITSLPLLMKDFLKDNESKLDCKQLQYTTGLSKRNIDEYLKEIHKKKNK